MVLAKRTFEIEKTRADVLLEYKPYSDLAKAFCSNFQEKQNRLQNTRLQYRSKSTISNQISSKPLIDPKKSSETSKRDLLIQNYNYFNPALTLGFHPINNQNKRPNSYTSYSPKISELDGDPKRDKKTVTMINLFWISISFILTLPVIIVMYVFVEFFMLSIVTALLIIAGTLALFSLLLFFAGRRMARKRLKESFDYRFYRNNFFLTLLLYLLAVIITIPIFGLGALVVAFVLLYSSIWLIVDKRKRRKARSV